MFFHNILNNISNINREINPPNDTVVVTNNYYCSSRIELARCIVK